MPYVNYHRHSHYSNVMLPDSTATNQDYCKRAVELGQTIISSCEHGTAGHYRECADLAEKYGLKWRYVAEGYFVKDMTQKDKTNCHIILAAKTAKGIGDINEALSKANIDGYYYRPRLDINLLLSLDPNDVFITTACVGGVWNYGYNKDTKTYDWQETDAIVSMLHKHYNNSMMLEVQYHNTDKQKEINKHILELRKEYGIDIIAGLDSHYIYPQDKVLRDVLLESRHLKYEDEDGWYMDYPSEEETIRRFKEQGVLSDNEIKIAMDNTNIFYEFEDVVFDKSKKLPTIYPNLSQDEKNELYRSIIRKKWLEYRKTVPRQMWDRYQQGIKYEVDTITSTNTSDYFLLDYEIVKRFNELGGRLTKTGRGSAPSYFTNALLGFSSIDRFALPITMYPDRFISADRLKAGSLPDIDMNVADPDIFAQAQAQVIGPWHSAPMVAFGTLKRLSSWKMYCRAKKVDFEIANALSEKLSQYELACKHAEDPSDIDIMEYVPQQYRDMLHESEQYMGTIDSISQHPCAYMVCNMDIRREFGVFRLLPKQGKKKEIYAAFIDGATADRYGYLKNDDLKVDIVKINADIYKSIGMQQPSVPQLLKMVQNDQSTWSMYEKGLTLGLNQMEKDKSRDKVMTYCPHNISEMAAICAGIRPAFQSMISKLIHRQDFEYGIPALDRLLQTKELPQSFILYQEQMMTVLQWAGFSAPQSYASIKAIAKKHPQKVLPLKARFLNGFKTRLIEEEHVETSTAEETANKVWTIISDACGYGFNSSHATAVALDSIYTAWAKAHYPYETYVTLLRNYSEKGDKDRIDLAKKQMKKGFKINVGVCRFHQDNRDYFIDKDAHTITDSLTSIKGVGKKDAEAIYRLGLNHYNSFIDLLLDIEHTTGALNSGVIQTLIKSDYFIEFGTNGKLLSIFNEFNKGENKYADTYCQKTRTNRIAWLRQFEKNAEQRQMSPEQIIPFEIQKYGTPYHVYPYKAGYFAVLDVDDKYSPKVLMYSLGTGAQKVVKIRKNIFSEYPLKIGDIIYMNKYSKKQAYEYINNEPVPRKNVFDLWIDKYSKVNT